jgi:hypothetical protein
VVVPYNILSRKIKCGKEIAQSLVAFKNQTARTLDSFIFICFSCCMFAPRPRAASPDRWGTRGRRVGCARVAIFKNFTAPLPL